MTLSSKTRRIAVMAGAAAFAAVSLGASGTASAQRGDGEVYRDYRDRHDRYDRYDRYDRGPGFDDDHYRGDRGWGWYGEHRYDLGGYDQPLDHFDRDMAHYDRNNDGYLDRREQRAYFRHLAEMGLFGRLSPYEERIVGRVAPRFDRDNDGRIQGEERRALRLFIVAMRRFERADRDNDGRLTRWEMRYASRFFPPFSYLDWNGDGVVTRDEIRTSILHDFRQGRI